MKHILLLFLFSFLSLACYGQKLHRQYSFFPQEQGNVYFIYPQKGFMSSDKTVVKDLEYDVTYLSGGDSATFTFSYFTQSVFQAKTIQISTSGGTVLYETPVEMMFTYPRKKYWQQRAQFSIPYTVLSGLYQSPEPFQLNLIGERELLYTIKPKNWKKQSEMTNKIFEIIKYNR